LLQLFIYCHDYGPFPFHFSKDSIYDDLMGS